MHQYQGPVFNMDSPRREVLEQPTCDILQGLCEYPELVYCISCPVFHKAFGK